VKIRFQADNDLRKAISRAIIRRNSQIDFRTTPNTDVEVLELAAREGRILISHDFQTMPGRFRKFIESQRSPGVFLIAQDLPVSEASESLVAIWAATAPEEWENRLCLIPSLVSVVIGPSK
jgi:hypothetical protein